MFKVEQREQRTIGYSYENNNAFFFFGNRETSRSDLASFFPQYKFAFLKQVHGRKIIEASLAPEDQEADGHFTFTKGLALVVQTADCIPVLLANDKSVCAIHSGWKGAAQNIVGAAQSLFREQPASLALIGPHILPSSFEIGLDVAEQLSTSVSNSQNLRIKHTDPNKTYFDLTEVVRRQIFAALGASTPIAECLHDTVTDANFHSFRRDKEKSGRQYSFVVLKE